MDKRINVTRINTTCYNDMRAYDRLDALRLTFVDNNIIEDCIFEIAVAMEKKKLYDSDGYWTMTADRIFDMVHERLKNEYQVTIDDCGDGNCYAWYDPIVNLPNIRIAMNVSRSYDTFDVIGSDLKILADALETWKDTNYDVSLYDHIITTWRHRTGGMKND